MWIDHFHVHESCIIWHVSYEWVTHQLIAHASELVAHLLCPEYNAMYDMTHSHVNDSFACECIMYCLASHTWTRHTYQLLAHTSPFVAHTAQLVAHSSCREYNATYGMTHSHVNDLFTCESIMYHSSCHIWKCRMYKWVMYDWECHTWMSHTHQFVAHSSQLASSAPIMSRVQSLYHMSHSHVNETFTSEWVIIHTCMSHASFVMSHINASHVWLSLARDHYR